MSEAQARLRIADLYRAYAPSLRVYAALLAQEEHRGEDLLHDVFALLLEPHNLARAEAVGPLTWLRGRLAGDAIEAHRKRTGWKWLGRRPADAPLTVVHVDSLASRELDHAYALAMRDEAEAALSGLPSRDATLLRLRFLEGLNQQEIAARLGVTASRVSQLLGRLLDRLGTGRVQSRASGDYIRQRPRPAAAA